MLLLRIRTCEPRVTHHLIGAGISIVARVSHSASFSRYVETRGRSIRGKAIPGFRAKSAQPGLRSHSISSWHDGGLRADQMIVFNRSFSGRANPPYSV